MNSRKIITFTFLLTITVLIVGLFSCDRVSEIVKDGHLNHLNSFTLNVFSHYPELVTDC